MRFVLFLFALFALVAAARGQTLASLARAITSLKAELADAKTDLAATKRDLAAARRTIAALQDGSSKVNADLRTLGRSVNSTKTIVTASVNQINNRLDQAWFSIQEQFKTFSNSTSIALTNAFRALNNESVRINEIITYQQQAYAYGFGNLTSMINTTQNAVANITQGLGQQLSSIALQGITSAQQVAISISQLKSEVYAQTYHANMVASLFNISDVPGTQVKLLGGLAIQGNLVVLGAANATAFNVFTLPPPGDNNNGTGPGPNNNGTGPF
jgi:septal ring factor EnvC (AmiA/AmiB activator)